MDTKLQLTTHFANLNGIDVSTPHLLNNIYRICWQNIRHNGERSFALTEKGYEIVSPHLKFYQIDLPDNFFISNQLVIWLDKFIDCPYYLSRKSIFVSKEKLAVQLILFNGDLNKFGKAKEKTRKAELTY